MAEPDTRENNAYENDSFDINELASLNEDISPEFIEQLQSQVSMTMMSSPSIDDSSLFEEFEVKNSDSTDRNDEQDINIDKPEELNANYNKENTASESTKAQLEENIDDNFIKKYKAKLNKQNVDEQLDNDNNSTIENFEAHNKEETIETSSMSSDLPSNIETLSDGNIIEKPLSKEQIEYSESLDYADNNINYSKYVIYIDPGNKEFIDSLTVKERKNLINNILKEQNDISVTKKNLNRFQTILKHCIVAIITVAITIPIVYTLINASLEASINNYRRSQDMFKTLYKEHGKITNIK